MTGPAAALGGRGELGIVAPERHPGERRIPAGMVVGVAAVGAGHRHHRVVAGAALADGVQHPDDVADHPHPHGAPQVLEAVHVVVQRRTLGAELGGQRVDRQRVPTLTVEEGQRGVDDGVAAQPGGT